MNVINYTLTLDIIVYSKSHCPNCEAAKRLLKDKGLVFEEVDVEQIPAAMEMLRRDFPEVRQMPQIFINDQRVGGLAGLQAALKQLGVAA